MIKLLGLLGIATFTFTNVTGPPSPNNNYYNNGLVDYYISYEIAGDDDSQNNSFWYTSPLKINENLTSNSIQGFNGNTLLSYGDNYYTMFSDNTYVGSNQETIIYIEGYRNNFYIDISDELSSTIDISVNGDRIIYDYDISVSYRLTNVGYNDADNLLYPKFIEKSVSFGGSYTGAINYIDLFISNISEHTITQNYIDLIYIDKFTIFINCYSELHDGEITISLDNDYTTTDKQHTIFNAYNNYLDQFLEDVIIPDFQLSNFLITSVSGFMDFEIAPNVSLGGVLGIILAFGLVFFVIKYFAGG